MILISNPYTSVIMAFCATACCFNLGSGILCPEDALLNRAYCVSHDWKVRSKQYQSDIQGPAGAYMYFAAKRRSPLKQEHPEMKFDELTMQMVREWKIMSAKERVPWTQLAEQDKERFEAECDIMSIYVSNGHPGSDLYERPRAVWGMMDQKDKELIKDMEKFEHKFTLTNGCILEFDIKCLNGTQTSPEPSHRDTNFNRRPSWQIGPGRKTPNGLTFGELVAEGDLIWQCCKKETSPISLSKIMTLREEPRLDSGSYYYVHLKSILDYESSNISLGYSHNTFDIAMHFCDAVDTIWGWCFKITIPDAVLARIFPDILKKIQAAKRHY
jgi:hypothetical protein